MSRFRMSTTTTARSAGRPRRSPSTSPGTRRSEMMLLRQVALAVSGRPSRPLEAEKVSGVSTDTRSIRAGDLFFALRGANYDAHDYLAQAFEKGAVAAIVDRPVEAKGLTLTVQDTLQALGDLAAAYRMTLPARVIGVCGSNGKTTTKEMIAHILRKDR